MNLHESGLSSKNLFVGILTVITLCFGWVPLWAMDFDLSGDATADIRNEKDGSVFVNIKQKGEDVFNAGLQKIEKIPGAGKLKSLRTNESWHDRTMGFGEHKPNYFLPVSYSTFQGDRKEKEAKFQLSFKQGFFKMGGNVIFFAYTQKSFWQVFDLENSRPFRETNYNPELFFRSDIVTTDHLGSFALDFGYEHESNGAREPISRSWDRLYFIIKHKSDFLVLKYKYWYRLPEDP
ncbi:MAG: phospholipase A, partial [Deltaproteobacteria bacterium]|nr:phospholipase A [Deltaproteobacteria bacterium]